MRIQFKNTNIYKHFSLYFKLCSRKVKNEKISSCFKLKKLLKENENFSKCDPIIDKNKNKETRLIVNEIKKELGIQIKVGEEFKKYTEYVNAYLTHTYSREDFDKTRYDDIYRASRYLEEIQGCGFKPYKYKFYIKLKKMADSIGLVIEELNKIVQEVKNYFYETALKKIGIPLQYYETKDLLDSYETWYDKNHNGKYLKVC